VTIERDLPPKDEPAAMTSDADVDLALLRKSAAGDGHAFHDLVDRHADRLYRLAVTLVGATADAEDVLQETFTGAYRGLSGFQGRASVKTWLTRILVTQAAKWRRDRRRRAVESSGDSTLDVDEARLVARSHAPPGGAGLVESRIDVHAAVARLSPEHRDVIVLREFEQMSYEEIAEALDVPRGTVESRLHRARAELRSLLSAYVP
jgi:RNA polymerase sigma-70 factor, ECF subfamily